MNDQENTAEVATLKKAKKETLEIIRGRMPVALVAVIRFGDHATEAIADVARKFGTTVGKISDIRGGSNFGYVTEAFVPTQTQIDQSIEFIKRHPRYDADNVDTVLVELDALGVATEEQAKAFEEARVAARGQNTKTKSGDDANAGGGNRRGAGAKPADEASSDDLLA